METEYNTSGIELWQGFCRLYPFKINITLQQERWVDEFYQIDIINFDSIIFQDLTIKNTKMALNVAQLL